MQPVSQRILSCREKGTKCDKGFKRRTPTPERSLNDPYSFKSLTHFKGWMAIRPLGREVLRRANPGIVLVIRWSLRRELSFRIPARPNKGKWHNSWHNPFDGGIWTCAESHDKTRNATTLSVRRSANNAAPCFWAGEFLQPFFSDAPLLGRSTKQTTNPCWARAGTDDFMASIEQRKS